MVRNDVIKAKASVLITEAFAFKSRPIVSPKISSSTQQLKFASNLIQNMKANLVSYHDDVFGEYCTVIINNNPTDTVIIDALGNIVEGISSNHLYSCFADICNNLDFTNVDRYCLSGVITPIGLFRSAPYSVNKYMDRFFRISQDDVYPIYDYRGTVSICPVNEIIESKEFTDYIGNIKMYDDITNRSYELQTNIDLYNRILLSSLHSDHCFYYSKTNQIYENLYSVYEDSSFCFYPYDFNYSITTSQTTSLSAGANSFAEYRNDLLGVDSLQIVSSEDIDIAMAEVKQRLSNKGDDVIKSGVIIKATNGNYSDNIDLKITSSTFTPLNGYVGYHSNDDLKNKYSYLLRLHRQSNIHRSKCLSTILSESKNFVQDSVYLELTKLCGVVDKINTLSYRK